MVRQAHHDKLTMTEGADSFLLLHNTTFPISPPTHSRGFGFACIAVGHAVAAANGQIDACAHGLRIDFTAVDAVVFLWKWNRDGSDIFWLRRNCRQFFTASAGSHDK